MALACLADGTAGADGAETLVRRELGELAADTDSAARLRETALAYLIGHPIEERRVYVELALHVVRAFGAGPQGVNPAGRP